MEKGPCTDQAMHSAERKHRVSWGDDETARRVKGRNSVVAAKNAREGLGLVAGRWAVKWGVRLGNPEGG